MGYGNAAVWVRCRLMATSTPETIVEESGNTWSEALDVYAEATRDALDPSRREGAVGIANVLAGFSGVALLIGLAVLVLMGRR